MSSELLIGLREGEMWAVVRPGVKREDGIA